MILGMGQCIMQVTGRYKRPASLINQLKKVAEMTLNIISESEQKRLAKNEYMKQYRAANKEKLAAQKVEYRQANKEKLAEYQKEYCHSKEGLVAKIYGDQRSSSKHRNHALPDYTTKELREWVLSQPNFEQLYQDWEDSGFEKAKRPSCDRLDDYKSYTLDNLRLVTWSENNARGHADRRYGINNKNSKAVLQFTREGIVIAEHHSAYHASRVIGVHQGHLSACCNGKRKTAGGFVWCFA